MVEMPENYRWSSYHHNALGKEDILITEHGCFHRIIEVVAGFKTRRGKHGGDRKSEFYGFWFPWFVP